VCFDGFEVIVVVERCGLNVLAHTLSEEWGIRVERWKVWCGEGERLLAVGRYSFYIASI
jgi:hypothetical protein